MNHEHRMLCCEHQLRRCRDRMSLLESELSAADAKLREDLTRELRALRRRYRRGEEHLARVRLGAAESWCEDHFGTGLFAIFDNIGGRIDGLFGRAD